jgi:hypothetical protein
MTVLILLLSKGLVITAVSSKYRDLNLCLSRLYIAVEFP